MSQVNYPQEDGTYEPHEQSAQPEEKPHYVQPHYVIIDDRLNKDKEGSFESGNQKAKSPNSPRFLCFLGLIFCSIFGLGMIAMSFFSTLISTCYLFRNAHLNDSMCHFWKLTAHTLVAGLGCILGLMVPTVGLGLIVLYFTATGEINDKSLLNTFFKQAFNKF